MTGRPASAPRSVVITGASNGLGAALARHYAAGGVHLLLIARHAERLAAVAADCTARGATVSTALADVREAETLTRHLLQHDARHPVELVIANAGIEASLGPAGEPESVAQTLAQIDTNLDGALATVLPLIAPMQARRRGGILLVSSLAALAPLPDQPAYSAAKAGLLAWGEAARPWLRTFGISVTVACPGFIASGMSAGFEGWRPFEWDAARAARRMAQDAARGRALSIFPWPLVLLVRIGRLAPRAAREMVLARLFAARIRRHTGPGDTGQSDADLPD